MSSGFWNLVLAELAFVGGPISIVAATLVVVAIRNKKLEARDVAHGSLESQAG